jgi:hypothetical protein
VQGQGLFFRDGRLFLLILQDDASKMRISQLVTRKGILTLNQLAISPARLVTLPHFTPKSGERGKPRSNLGVL